MTIRIVMVSSAIVLGSLGFANAQMPATPPVPPPAASGATPGQPTPSRPNETVRPNTTGVGPSAPAPRGEGAPNVPGAEETIPTRR
jgi:hypothetical protein